MFTIEESADGATLTIIPVGRFDARMHRTFLEAYTTRPVPSSHYVVDFAQTEYIDNTGLGMLLKLREFAGGGQEGNLGSEGCAEQRDCLPGALSTGFLQEG